MDKDDSVGFSSFEGRLSPQALACFRTLLAFAKDTIMQDGPRQSYEITVSGLMEASGADGVETIAQSIRDILECRVEMKRGDYLYFFPFFAAVSIEDGMVRYSLPDDLQTAIPSVVD